MVKHSKTGVFVPEMIFGQLLTSSNYKDAERKSKPRTTHLDNAWMLTPFAVASQSLVAAMAMEPS